MSRKYVKKTWIISTYIEMVLKRIMIQLAKLYTNLCKYLEKEMIS